jgi:hypothetical protein
MNILTGSYFSGKSGNIDVDIPTYGNFKVGSTVNACTKGIWLYTHPSRVGALSVFFLDTEGLGSTSRNSTQDSRIFALSLLISSYFIYNSRGVIDGSALDDLSLVANITELIHIRSTQNKDQTPVQSLQQFFPNFLWVLRDFTLKLEDENGQKINSRQYLENCLKPQPGIEEAIAAKNKVRQLISSFFPERDCVTMVRPAEQESLLKNLPNIPLTELRPAFQRQVHGLIERIKAGLRPKQMMGKTLNGEMVATLTRCYVDSLNSGSAPVISTAWERVVQGQCNNAYKSAVIHYDKTFGELKETEKESNQVNLKQCHLQAKSVAKEFYWRLVPGKSDEVSIAKANDLKIELRKRWKTLHEENKKCICRSIKEKWKNSKYLVDIKDMLKGISIDNMSNPIKNTEIECINQLHKLLCGQNNALRSFIDIANRTYIDERGISSGSATRVELLHRQLFNNITSWSSIQTRILSSLEQSYCASLSVIKTKYDSLQQIYNSDMDTLFKLRSDTAQLQKDLSYRQDTITKKVLLRQSRIDSDLNLIISRKKSHSIKNAKLLEEFTNQMNALEERIQRMEAVIAEQRAEQSLQNNISLKETASDSDHALTYLRCLVVSRDKRVKTMKENIITTRTTLENIKSSAKMNINAIVHKGLQESITMKCICIKGFDEIDGNIKEYMKHLDFKNGSIKETSKEIEMYLKDGENVIHFSNPRANRNI